MSLSLPHSFSLCLIFFPPSLFVYLSIFSTFCLPLSSKLGKKNRKVKNAKCWKVHITRKTSNIEHFENLEMVAMSMNSKISIYTIVLTRKLMQKLTRQDSHILIQKLHELQTWFPTTYKHIVE